MYRHLLVPVDGTDLSTQVVGQAVEFARTLGARVTFFHAVPDHSASLRGEAEVVWTTSPSEYRLRLRRACARTALQGRVGRARAGGAVQRRQYVSDKPYEAILAAARDAGCDLIYMASHGRRSNIGMMLGSQTLKVLMQTEIPVLVAATSNPGRAGARDRHHPRRASLAGRRAACLDAPDRDRACRRQAAGPRSDARHRALPEGLSGGAASSEGGRLPVPPLRERTSSVDAELDELQRQHERDHQLVAELAALVDGEQHRPGDARASRAALCAVHLGPPGPRGRRDPAGGAEVPDRRRLGRDRRRVREQQGSAFRRATPTCSTGGCSRASSTWRTPLSDGGLRDGRACAALERGDPLQRLAQRLVLLRKAEAHDAPLGCWDSKLAQCSLQGRQRLG